VELDALMNRFRVASRELFNQFFRIDDPDRHHQHAWVLEERYGEVESLLFQKLVLEPAELPLLSYGVLHPGINVRLRHSAFAPIMLNREIDSGYWDYPLKEVATDAKLALMSFFDWDQLDYRDHRYVRVQVIEWSSQPSTVGKHALIEAPYVSFAKA
jgi:hypothetical protein